VRAPWSGLQRLGYRPGAELAGPDLAGPHLAGPIATVHLPQRVPAGLHGAWLPTQE